MTTKVRLARRDASASRTWLGSSTSATGTWHTALSSQPRLVGETKVGPGTGRDGLAIAPPHAAPDRILDADRRVADLVKSSGHVGRSAIGDALPVDVKLAPELSVMMVVEAEVQTCPKLDPRVAQHLNSQRSLGPVFHDGKKAPTHQPAIIRVKPKVWPYGDDRLTTAVRMFDPRGDGHLIDARHGEAREVQVHGVARAVGSLE